MLIVVIIAKKEPLVIHKTALRKII